MDNIGILLHACMLHRGTQLSLSAAVSSNLGSRSCSTSSSTRLWSIKNVAVNLLHQLLQIVSDFCKLCKPLLHNNSLGKNGCKYFVFCFSQLSQIPGLQCGVNRFCTKSSVYSQLPCITDGQTDGKVISTADRTK